MSDGGRQLTSRELKQFTNTWGIDHIVSSPSHQQENGKAEAAVKLIRNKMKKTIRNGTDQYAALLELRNTPRQDNSLSPVEMLFGRRTRSFVPDLSKVSDNDRLDNAIQRKAK